MNKLYTEFCLNELHHRIFYCFLSFILCLFVSFTFSDSFFYFFVKPLLEVDPSRSFLFTDLREGFLATIQLSIFISVVAILPISFYEVWSFLKPSFFLYEIRYETWLSFGFYVVCFISLVYTFFLHSLWIFFLGFELDSGLVKVYLEAKIGSYFTFLFEIFSIAFVLMIIPFFLQKYSKHRLAIWFLTLLIVAFFSPPDFVVQVALTVFAYFLFEAFFFFHFLGIQYGAYKGL